MNGESRLKSLISDLDNEARREIALAAGEGRFDDLLTLTPIAKEIAALAARWSSSKSPASGASTGTRATAASPMPTTNQGSTHSHDSKKYKKTEYPQFVREKQDLVKLGWSPSEKQPYEHRVPKGTVFAVASTLASKGKTGQRFTMDDVLTALASSQTAEPVPSYQIYAVFSWLKWAGMVLQHGRQGYTVVRPHTIATSIETAWQSLPLR